MDLTEFLLADNNLPFIATAAVFAAFLAIELFALVIGLSFMGGSVDLFDTEVSAETGVDVDKPGISLFGWINAGNVPGFVVCVALVGIITVLGYTGQWIVNSLFGFLAPSAVAGPVALMLSLPVVRQITIILGRHAFKDETSAIDVSSLVGSTGVVTLPVCKKMAGQVRVRDNHGVNHYVLAYPEGDEEIEKDIDVVLLEQNESTPPTFTIRKI